MVSSDKRQFLQRNKQTKQKSQVSPNENIHFAFRRKKEKLIDIIIYHTYLPGVKNKRIFLTFLLAFLRKTIAVRSF